MRTCFKSQRTRIREAENRIQDWLNPNPNRIAEVQLRKLQKVWADAITNIPFYKNLIKKKEAPHVIESIKQFRQEVPFLTKDMLRNQANLFRRVNPSPDKELMTAGSTGEPLHFGVWNTEGHHNAVNVLVGRLANGMDIRKDKIFLIWGHSHLLGTGLKGKINHAKRKTQDYLIKYKRVDAYNLSRKKAILYLHKMLKYKPKVLIGYSNVVDLFVRYNEEMQDKAASIKLKMIICTAEMFSRQDSKKKIESFFEAPVIMEYGSVECGGLAYQLHGKYYKSFWWSKFLELDGSEKNYLENSPLLVTDLNIRYLPIIRYYIGDEISGANKLCEGQLICFKNIAGRMHDMIDLGDGEVIHSMGLFHCIHQEPEVLNIQLILEPDEIRILLVCKKCEGIEARIRNRLLDLNARLQSCKIDYVEDLQTNLAGKRQWIIDRRNILPEGHKHEKRKKI